LSSLSATATFYLRLLELRIDRINHVQSNSAAARMSRVGAGRAKPALQAGSAEVPADEIMSLLAKIKDAMKVPEQAERKVRSEFVRGVPRQNGVTRRPKATTLTSL
jgi:hypothetical protein